MAFESQQPRLVLPHLWTQPPQSGATNNKSEIHRCVSSRVCWTNRMARALPSPEREGEETGAPRILGAFLQSRRPTTPIGRWFSMSNQRTSTESTTGHYLLRRPVVLPSTGAVRGALRGGVKAPPVGVARRRRAAAAAVPAAAPYFPAPRFPRHGNVAVRAPVRARGYGFCQRARCRCVAKRATALKARVLHARA